MTETILKVEDVYKSYDDHRVLKGVNLEIGAGSVVGLLGTNAAGKSTLLKCMLGLLKPGKGSCSLMGDDAWDLSSETKAKIGYVPQVFSMMDWMKVEHSIKYMTAFYPVWDEELTWRLCDEWEIPRQQRIRTLSVGQKQKLSIIIALAHQPELLILDEPVASLDPIARREFIKSIVDFSSHENRTVLFSTHITSDLERVATHVAVLRNGQISYFDELDKLKDNVKRLRIRAEEKLPKTFNIASSINLKVEENSAIATVPYASEGVISELQSVWNAEVEVEDLNLEEIFLELHDA